jgi:gliding motility-associated-like protein
MAKGLILIWGLVFLAIRSSAQGVVACTTLGQTPVTAFPVCGTTTFNQNTVPYCGGNPIPGPCGNQGITDTNPFWYKFTCFSSGTLSFSIVPIDRDDDYDWQLFDVTNQALSNIYTSAATVVACDWSGDTGLTPPYTGSTGAASNSPFGNNSLYNCAGYAYPPYSAMPTLIKGHNYLLLVSHFTAFTPSEKGYSLTFGGGTASITDTTPPRLQSAVVSDCGSTVIKIALNKNMQCSSLAPDGSDFMLSLPGSTTPVGPAIISATGDNCNSGFDMDSLTLTFAGAIPQGSYLISAKNGSDGNTLLDICNTPVPVGDSAALMVPSPPPPTTLDSITPPGCSPTTLNLVFGKNILCSSVAADGSDFKVTGPSAVTVSGATCGGDSAYTVSVQLAGPIYQGGIYQIQLVTGSDGNTLIDECRQQVLPASLPFTVADTVSAQITYQVDLACARDTIDFSNAGGDNINTWKWIFDDTLAENGQDQLLSYSVFDRKTAELIVSNGICSDTSTVSVNLGNTLKAVFEATNLLCPQDKASFSDSSIGTIVSYNWDFGDGTGSTLETPPPMEYPSVQVNTNFIVRLIVTNAMGCVDTAYQPVQDIANCYIAVPSAFTPNGDGINDYLSPLNAYKAADLLFQVFDRWGNLVFQTRDWTVRWDGTVSGQQSPVGTYVWILRYTNTDTGQKVSQKGTSVLIR